MANSVRSEIKDNCDKIVQTDNTDEHLIKCKDNVTLDNNVLNNDNKFIGNVKVAWDNGFYTSVDVNGSSAKFLIDWRLALQQVSFLNQCLIN